MHRENHIQCLIKELKELQQGCGVTEGKRRVLQEERIDDIFNAAKIRMRTEECMLDLATWVAFET